MPAKMAKLASTAAPAALANASAPAPGATSATEDVSRGYVFK